MSARRRVVVTGLGMINPLGNDVKTVWDALVAGRSGVGYISIDPAIVVVVEGGHTGCHTFDDVGFASNAGGMHKVEATTRSDIGHLDRDLRESLAQSHHAAAHKEKEHSPRRASSFVGTSD